jgi:hypothetical protein
LFVKSSSWDRIPVCTLEARSVSSAHFFIFRHVQLLEQVFSPVGHVVFAFVEKYVLILLIGGHGQSSPHSVAVVTFVVLSSVVVSSGFLIHNMRNMPDY